MPDPSIALPEEHFEAVVYVGDGNSTQEVTTSFEPDLIWNKNRTTVYHNRLFDRVRGLDKSVYSNLNSAEDTYQDYGYPTATSSTSVTVGQGTDTNKLINLSVKTMSCGTGKRTAHLAHPTLTAQSLQQ